MPRRISRRSSPFGEKWPRQRVDMCRRGYLSICVCAFRCCVVSMNVRACVLEGNHRSTRPCPVLAVGGAQIAALSFASLLDVCESADRWFASLLSKVCPYACCLGTFSLRSLRISTPTFEAPQATGHFDRNRAALCHALECSVDDTHSRMRRKPLLTPSR